MSQSSMAAVGQIPIMNQPRSEPPPRRCEWPCCDAMLYPFKLWSEARKAEIWYPADPHCEEHEKLDAAKEERLAVDERLKRCELPRRLRGFSWDRHIYRQMDEAGALLVDQQHGRPWPERGRELEGVLAFKARVEAKSKMLGMPVLGITPENRAAFVELYQYHPHRETHALPKHSVIIQGTTGTGKTTLLACAVESLVRWHYPGRPPSQQGVRVLYCTETDLYRAAVEEFRTRHASVSLLDRARTAELVALDDFGAGEIVQDRDRKILENLILDRYNAELPVLITTNLTLPQISRKYGSRVGSRLAEMARRRVVSLVGADWRSGEEPEESQPAAQAEPTKRKRRKPAEGGAS